MIAERRPRAPRLGLGLGLGLLISLGPALAPATIEDQRSRLPPPAFECEADPISGVWQAHAYYAHVGQWYLLELSIERDPGRPESLRGTIRSEFWDGGPELAQPPLCTEAGERAAVIQTASGQAEGLALRFDAIDWRDLAACGPFSGAYLLDHFSGTIEPERMEFQSLLNADAPEWKDVPTVFRRVRCGPGSAVLEPKIIVAPPPYEPPAREGCGLRGA